MRDFFSTFFSTFFDTFFQYDDSLVEATLVLNFAGDAAATSSTLAATTCTSTLALTDATSSLFLVTTT